MSAAAGANQSRNERRRQSHARPPSAAPLPLSTSAPARSTAEAAPPRSTAIGVRRLPALINNFVRHCRPPLIAAVVAGIAGCAMRIDPPIHVHEPTTVYLADYGYHASVLLPRDDGMLSEFAYGQWEWFALNHYEWHDALRIALLPSGGALGTRVVAPPASQRDEPAPTRPATSPHPCGFCGQCSAEAQHTLNDFAAALWAQEVFTLRVERSRAGALRERLQTEYDAARATEVYNPLVRLTLVRSERIYWHHQNCNSVVGEWLESLGCRVSGCRSFAEFDAK